MYKYILNPNTGEIRVKTTTTVIYKKRKGIIVCDSDRDIKWFGSG